jgi:hypothetical protein
MLKTLDELTVEKKQLYERFVARLNKELNDIEYATRVADLIFMTKGLSRKKIAELCDTVELLIVAHDHNRYHGRPILDKVPSSDPSPYPDDTIVTGIPPGRDCLTKIPPFRSVIEAFDFEELGDWCVTIPGSTNKHTGTSTLKRHLACMTVGLDLEAVALCGQEWLNHPGKGKFTLTGAFVTKHIEDYLADIENLHFPVLAVVENYTPGVHIGDQYSYVCDGKYAYGTSRGAPASIWSDMSDPWPYQGSIDDKYMVETVCSFGPQRIVFIHPGSANFVGLSTIPEQVFKSKPTLQTPRTTGFLVGLHKEEMITTPQPECVAPDLMQPLADIVPLSDEKKPSYTRHLFETPKEHKSEIVAYSIMIIAVILAINYETTFLVPIPICLMWLYFHLFPEKIQPTNIVFRNYPLKFYGESNEQLQDWLTLNPIDPITKLRYGFYHIDADNIVSVPQGSPEANYTNVHRLIDAFCLSKGWAKKSHIVKYYELMRTVAPLIKTQDDFAIMDKVESNIKILTSSKPYKINVPVIDQLDIKLSSLPELRKYLCTKITHNVVSASVSNRVLRAGRRSTKTVEEHLALIRRFWKDHTPISVIKDLDPTPNILKYVGKKLRKYQDACENLGVHSTNPFYSTFLKIEAAAIDFINKKAVRMITPNSVLFNILWKNFFTAFEHILLSFKHPRINLPVFAKGMNYERRLETIREYSKYFRYVFPTDFKSFDSHHINQAAEAEVWWYNMLGLPKRVAAKLINAVHRGIVEYSGIQRCSGDLYTGSGNCLIVGSLLHDFTSDDMAYFCDGDDTLVFTNDPSIYKKISNELLDYGYELDDVDPIRLDGENDYEIPFCQVTYSKDKYYIDRNRALNKLLNITATNTTRAAEIVLGKLQAIQYFANFNIDFGVDLSPYLKHLECEDDSLRYKKTLIDNPDGLAHLDRYQEIINFDLTDDSNGIIVEIVRNITTSKLLAVMRRLAWMTPQAYRRALIRNIRATLDQVVARSGEYDEETLANMEKAERIIESTGPMLANYIIEAEKDRIEEISSSTNEAARASFIKPVISKVSVLDENLDSISNFSLDSE